MSGAARANVLIKGIYDGSLARDRAREWEQAYYEAHDPEARERKKRQESFARLQKWAYARLAARRAAEAALAGPGWEVLLIPHQELEQFARKLWHDGFMGIPWPAGWKVRWGDLRGQNALGICAHDPRLIVIDASAHEGYPSEQLVRTLAHELVHSQHRHDSHGAAFRETLRRLLACLLPDEAAPIEVAARRPEPPKGRTFGGHVMTWPGANEWEFR